MPAKKNAHKQRVPAMRYHAQKGLYRVTLSGRDVWLGSDETEAKSRYNIAVSEWLARGKAPEPPAADEITVVELVDLWLSRFAEDFYRESQKTLKEATATLLAFTSVYGRTPAAAFGPKWLKAYRLSMCDDTLCRQTVNRRIMLIRRVFAWGASEELIPPSVPQALATIEGLRAGRATGVREPERIRPVLWEHVEATLPYLPRPVERLVRLMWHCGARCGEVVGLLARDIDTCGAVWCAKPSKHKNAFRGHVRVLYFGPESQAVLKEAMLDAPLGRPLFSPLDVLAVRTEKAKKHRRPNQKPTPTQTDRAIGEVYDPHAVRRAVDRAIQKANEELAAKGSPLIPRWHPHQLRHSFATRVRKEIGLEAAAAVLGHADLETSKIYAELDAQMAIKVAQTLG